MNAFCFVWCFCAAVCDADLQAVQHDAQRLDLPADGAGEPLVHSSIVLTHIDLLQPEGNTQREERHMTSFDMF